MASPLNLKRGSESEDEVSLSSDRPTSNSSSSSLTPSIKCEKNFEDKELISEPCKPSSSYSKTSFSVEDILKPDKFTGCSLPDVHSMRNNLSSNWQPWLMEQSFRRSACIIPVEICSNYRNFETKIKGKLIYFLAYIINTFLNFKSKSIIPNSKT